MEEIKKWKYVLIVNDHPYFANSLWGLFKETLSYRFQYRKRGDGWWN